MLKKSGVLLVVLAGFLFAADDYTQWPYYRNIIVNTKSTGAGVTAAVAKFPLLVRLSAADSLVFKAARTTGQDVRFAKANGTHFNYHIERWDSTNRTAEIWVLVDTVKGSDSSAYLKMYWGNAAAADSSRATAVFDTSNGFIGVYHFVDSTKDVTGNGFNGINNGTTANDTCMIGRGRKFNGSSLISVSGYPDRPTGTMSCWFKPGISWGGSIEYHNPLWGKYTDGANNAVLSLRGSQFNGAPEGDAGCIQTKRESGTTTSYGSYLGSQIDTFPNDQWYHVAWIWGPTSDSLFVNGAMERGKTPGNVITIAGSVNDEIGHAHFDSMANIPAGYSADFYFFGRMDEFRMEKVIRSPSWINLCYKNQMLSGGADMLTRSGPILPQPPTSLTYSQPGPLYYPVGTAITTNNAVITPSIAVIDSFTVSPALPAGLSLSKTTGAISGTPTAAVNMTTYTITARNTGGPAVTRALNFAVYVRPQITTQPTSATVQPGNNAIFTTAATGGTPAMGVGYLWVRVTGTSTLSGAASPACTVKTVTTADNGTIVKCAAYYSLNKDTLWSNLCTLRVQAAPSGFTYSQNPAYYPVGTAIATNTATILGTIDSFTVASALPSGLAINKTNGAITGTPADTASLRKYAVTAKNIAGSAVCSLSLAVYSQPSITAQPATVSVRAGDTAKFSLTASGSAPLSYQWWRNTAPITGASGASYALVNAQATDEGAVFKCVVKYAPTGDSVVSNLCTLHVASSPTITQQPQSVIVRRGSAASFSVAAAGTPPLSYSWIKNGSETIQGVSGNSLTLLATLRADDNARFHCVVTNGAGSAVSTPCTLRVVSAGFSASPVTGADTVTVKFVDSSSGGVTAYQWEFGDGDFGTSPNPSHLYAAVDTYSVKQTVSAGGVVDSIRIVDFIRVKHSRPVARLFIDTLYATDSLAVHFTDSSKGVITRKKLDFGDGSSDTSMAAVAEHIYRDTGSYLVKFMVTGPGGSDTLTWPTYIYIYSKNDNPIRIKAQRLSPDSVAISYMNFATIPTRETKPIPPFVDSIGLWFRRSSLPASPQTDSLLCKYSLINIQKSGVGTFVDTIAVPFSHPADSMYYGFNTTLFWIGAEISAMKPGNGDLLLMRDTVRPTNRLAVSGSYLDVDSFAIYIDNISSLDSAKSDSVCIWYGFRDSVNFSDTARTKRFTLADVISGASQNRYRKTFRESRLNGDTARIFCAVQVVGKNRLASVANDSSFTAGRLRPVNPIRLFAKAITPTFIKLTWKEIGTGKTVTGMDSIVIWRGTRKVPLAFSISPTDFTALKVSVGDTMFISVGLNEKTRYYYGAHICSRGLWSFITDSSSATDSTPAIANTERPVNPVKMTKLAFNTVENKISASWRIEAPDTNSEIGIAYSLVTYPADTLNPPAQIIRVRGTVDSALVTIAGDLAFDTTYYVSLWYRKLDGKWGLPVAASQGTVKIPSDLSWQIVHYFVSYPETVSVFNGRVLLANNRGDTVQTTDTVKNWKPKDAGSRGFVLVSGGFYFAQHFASAPFNIGIKYVKDSIPAGYSGADVRIYRQIDGQMFVEKNTVVDTTTRTAWIVTNNLLFPFIAMIDTVPVSVTVLSAVSKPVISGKDIVDTFLVKDNCANVAWNFHYAKGDQSVKSADSNETVKSVDTVIRIIQRSYVNQESGVRARFTASDGPHTVSADVSRQVIRDSTSDVVSLPGGAWRPLQAAAELDSPGVKWALRDLNVDGKWYYDNSAFRLFRWYAYTDNSADSVKWVEYSDTTDWVFSISPCRLMWIKTRKPVVLHLGRGVTTSLKRSYTAVVAPQTWSDIALPYGFSIRVGDVIDSTNAYPANGGGNKGEALSFYYWQTDSVNQYRSRPLFLANFDKASPHLANKADSLSKTASGFTVYNSLETSVTLSIPPLPTTLSKYRTAQSLAKKTNRSGWAVRIAGKTGEGELSEVYCGYCEGEPGTTYYPVPTLFSGTGIRACDVSKRRFGHALARGNWSKERGISFDLAFFNSTEKMQTMDYQVEDVQQLPENVNVAIVDYATGAFEDASRNLQVSLAKGRTVYRRLVIGTDEYLSKVKRDLQTFKLALGATSMNPFSRMVKIRFSLPREGVNRVRFTIIDIMGRTVWEHSLWCGRLSGAQEYMWSGRTSSQRPVGAGMYVLRMTAFDEKRNAAGTFEKKIPYMPLQ